MEYVLILLSLSFRKLFWVNWQYSSLLSSVKHKHSIAFDIKHHAAHVVKLSFLEKLFSETNRLSVVDCSDTLTAVKMHNNKIPNLAFQLQVNAKKSPWFSSTCLDFFLFSVSPVRSSVIWNWLEGIDEIKNLL